MTVAGDGPYSARSDLGGPAQGGEARHHQQGRHVDAAGAGESGRSYPWEVCPGAGCAVVAAAPTARTQGAGGPGGSQQRS
jgi:hypothetical protein